MRHIEGPPMTQRQVREPCIEPSNAPEKRLVSQTAAYHPDNRGGGVSLSTRHHYIFCLSMLEPETLDQTQRFYPVFSGSIDAYLHRRRVLAQRILRESRRQHRDLYASNSSQLSLRKLTQLSLRKLKGFLKKPVYVGI